LEFLVAAPITSPFLFAASTPAHECFVLNIFHVRMVRNRLSLLKVFLTLSKAPEATSRAYIGQTALLQGPQPLLNSEAFIRRHGLGNTHVLVMAVLKADFLLSGPGAHKEGDGTYCNQKFHQSTDIGRY